MNFKAPRYLTRYMNLEDINQINIKIGREKKILYKYILLDIIILYIRYNTKPIL